MINFKNGGGLSAPMGGPSHQFPNEYYLVGAVIKPVALDLVREALFAQGINEFRATDTKMFTKGIPSIQLYRGAEYTVDYHPIIELEVIVTSEEERKVAIREIRKAARISEAHDGFVYWRELKGVINISTGEACLQVHF